jgi:hypothetical protein
MVNLYVLNASNYCLDGPGYLRCYLSFQYQGIHFKDGPGVVDTLCIQHLWRALFTESVPRLK